jgi:hypothetical protein
MKAQPMIWLPRILLIALAAFLVVFSFDVLEEGRPAGEIALGLALHNIPTLALLILVAVAWKREWIGSLVCLLLAVLYIIWSWGRFPVTVWLAIAGPLFIASLLYALGWRKRRAMRGSWTFS